MEASALNHVGAEGLRGPTPLLRIQSDERLVALTRRGNQAAYEALVARYQSRLLAFCRHMLGSREDAEDVLQEVFAAAFNAMLADQRPLNVRPWLYRIARNRSLNHLRRAQAIGVDSMDVHLSEHGATTADKVHKREEFRQLMEDVQGLPETQRTALLLREIDALSYEQIAEAMETTVPSIKSLLVRARVSLAEASEARLLTCDEVREELGEVAEGLRRTSAPVRRHLRGCDRCVVFRKQLRDTNKALASILPVGPLLVLKKLLLANLGTTASAGGGVAAAAGAGAAGVGAGGAAGASLSVVASKAAAGIAAAAIVTAGAVEVDHVRHRPSPAPAAAAAAAPIAVPAAPVVVASEPQPVQASTAAPATPATRDSDAKKRAADARAAAKRRAARRAKAKDAAATPDAGGTAAAVAGAAGAATQTPGSTAASGGVVAPAEGSAAPSAAPPASTPPSTTTTPTTTQSTPGVVTTAPQPTTSTPSASTAPTATAPAQPAPPAPTTSTPAPPTPADTRPALTGGVAAPPNARSRRSRPPAAARGQAPQRQPSAQPAG